MISVSHISCLNSLLTDVSSGFDVVRKKSPVTAGRSLEDGSLPPQNLISSPSGRQHAPKLESLQFEEDLDDEEEEEDGVSPAFFGKHLRCCFVVRHLYLSIVAR